MTEDKLQTIINRLRSVRVQGEYTYFEEYKSLLLKVARTCAETGDDEPFGPFVNVLSAQFLHCLTALYEPDKVLGIPPLPSALNYLVTSIKTTYQHALGGIKVWDDQGQLDLTRVHSVRCATCGRLHGDHDLTQHLACTEVGEQFVTNVVTPIMSTPFHLTPPNLFDAVRAVWSSFLAANESYPLRERTSREKHNWA